MAAARPVTGTFVTASGPLNLPATLAGVDSG